jgi:hypothetical protein
MKPVDYQRAMRYTTPSTLEALKHHGGRNDGFLTDQPIGIKLAEDDYVRVRYDTKAMRWIANRPSRIKYPTLGN